MSAPVVRGISSMATRQVLAELVDGFAQQSGIHVAIESVGGVDAAKRVQAGEAFDVVILAPDAIARIAGGRATGRRQPGGLGAVGRGRGRARWGGAAA